MELIITGMVIDMDETRLRSIEQLKEFLRATPQVTFAAHSLGVTADNERYEHISRVLTRFDYPQRNKRECGVVLAYLRRTSGYSRAHLTRLVKRWAGNRLAQQPLVKRYRAPAAPFARTYTALDVELLVEMDRAHEDVCGPAIAHLLQRAHTVYGDARYERLAQLSVSHLYNLRKREDYQARRVSFTKTRAVCNPIGVRKAPRPKGRAGYVRIDTVHQGDLDGVKGVYHITCVDEVCQWQVQACVQGISEAFLLPALALVIEQFPFEIAGFHSDNGSEYINGRVAKLLEKLRVEPDQITLQAQQRQRAGREQECQRGAQAHGLQPHPAEVRPADQRVLSNGVQSVAESAPPLHVRQRDRQRQGQGHQALSPRGCADAAGVPEQALRQRPCPLEDGRDAGGVAGAGRCKNRPGCRAGNAARQGRTVRSVQQASSSISAARLRPTQAPPKQQVRCAQVEAPRSARVQGITHEYMCVIGGASGGLAGARSRKNKPDQPVDRLSVLARSTRPTDQPRIAPASGSYLDWKLLQEVPGSPAFPP